MDKQQQITQLFQLFLQFLTFINSNYQSIYFLNNELDISLYYNSGINNANQSTKDYIPVIEFIQNKQLNPQDFYSKFNELDSNNMVHDYEYPLNREICWNSPTGQKDKQGKYTQFKKCKWNTSNNSNPEHDCIGMAQKALIQPKISYSHCCDDHNNLTISQKALEIAKVPEIRFIINEIIQTITKKKGFVVVGRDATTKILPDAEIKLVFDTEIESRVCRRAKQILDVECEARMYQSSQVNDLTELEIIGNVLSDILKQDFDAYNLVMEAKKVATIIDTSNLSVEQSSAKKRVLENGNFQEELSGRSNIEPTVEKFIKYENWQITNYVSDKAFIHIFPDLEKRYEFILNLLEFYQKCLENYEHIERDVLPRNQQDDLFRDAQD
ncbi:19551_t:CDS:2 [Gigaspora rosea]|nr:19551_t:CDS:2 [Gigaspora rosea]